MEFFFIAPTPKKEHEEQISDLDGFLIALVHSRLGVRRKILILKRYLMRLQETGQL
jgi:hypothetical protein